MLRAQKRPDWFWCLFSPIHEGNRWLILRVPAAGA